MRNPPLLLLAAFAPFLTAATCDSSQLQTAELLDAGGEPDPLVATCQSKAMAYATLCQGMDNRACLWTAYASLCQTGNTKLLVDSMNCLDPNTCRTFSDPNDGATCLANVHGNEEPDASLTYISRTCARCGGSCAPAGTSELIPYLSAADLAALTTCGSAACSFQSIVTACSTVSGLALFQSCF
jgi:hypothetical protein